MRNFQNQRFLYAVHPRAQILRYRLICQAIHTSQSKPSIVLHEDRHAKVANDVRDHLSRTNDITSVTLTDILTQHYPDYYLTRTHRGTGLLDFAKIGSFKAKADKHLSFYADRERGEYDNESKSSITLKDEITFGRLSCTWKGTEFFIYVAGLTRVEYGFLTWHFVLWPRGDSPDEIVAKQVDCLLLASLKHGHHVDDQIWLFDEGRWEKNSKLFSSVQGSRWEDVILNDEIKTELKNDVVNFYARQDQYKSFGVPWKRGIILHGLPGNGKTISVKALMCTLSQLNPPIPTLYVKALSRDSGQDSIRAIFEKARETAPCLLILEDLDSLVGDHVRSFFLNELDGLEANDGIMVIGSTNYLDRLDPGISKRPSRFDRKFHFPLPARSERIKYCEHWRSKLIGSNAIDITPDLCAKIADNTEGLSFAYLQELFVSSLMALLDSALATPVTANPESRDEVSNAKNTAPSKSDMLWTILENNISKMRKEMEDNRKSVADSGKNSVMSDASSGSLRKPGFGR